MNQPKKISTKIPTNKERGACLCRGYDLSSTYLGGGAMGRVFLAIPGPIAIKNNPKLQIFFKQNSSPKVAVKIIYVDRGAGHITGFVKELSREVENLNAMFGYQSIIHLLDVFISCKRIFLVTEYVAGGNLKQVHRAIARRSIEKNVMREGVARHYFKELVKGVACLHDRKIAHRDLKLENIFVTKTGRVKIGDLGFSIKVVNEWENPLVEQDTGTFCGTPLFMAPEVLRCNGVYQAIKADIWSLGVILYILTNSQYPYDGENMKDLLRDIKKKGKNLFFRDGLSKGCRDLIKKMLQLEPVKRPNVRQIQKHRWFKKPVVLPGNYSKQETQVNIKALLKLQKEPRFKLEAVFVRSYLLQRAKLLRTYQRKLRKRLPNKIYGEFGLPICVPWQEGDNDSLLIEPWRLKSVSLPSTISDEKPEDREESSGSVLNASLAACPGYNLSRSCGWTSNRFGSTVGAIKVKRIIKNISMLGEWSIRRYDNEVPVTEMDKYIQLYNTVYIDPQQYWPWSNATPQAYPLDTPIPNTKLSYYFVHYSPHTYDTTTELEVGDFKMTERKEVDEKATASEVHNSDAIWPTPPAEMKHKVSNLISKLVTTTAGHLQHGDSHEQNISVETKAFKKYKDNLLVLSRKSEPLLALPANLLTLSLHMNEKRRSLNVISNTDFTQIATKNEAQGRKIVSRQAQATLTSLATEKDLTKIEIETHILQGSISSMKKSSILKHKILDQAINQRLVENEAIKHKKKVALSKTQSIHKTPCFKIQEEKLPAPSVVISTTDKIERRQKQKIWRQNLRKKLQTENITVKNEQMNTPTTPLINGLMDICDRLIDMENWIEKNEAEKKNLYSYVSTIMKKTHSSKKENLLSNLLSHLLKTSKKSEKNKEPEILLSQNCATNHLKKLSRNSTSSSNSPSYIFDEQDNNNKSNSVLVTNSKLNGINDIKKKSNMTLHETSLSTTIETEPPINLFRRLFKCFKKPKLFSKDDEVESKKQSKKSLFRCCFCIC